MSFDTDQWEASTEAEHLLQQELVELRKLLADAAMPDCLNCDGSGIFYGNVCVCGCVNNPVPRPRVWAEAPDDDL